MIVLNCNQPYFAYFFLLEEPVIVLELSQAATLRITTDSVDGRMPLQINTWVCMNPQLMK
jgi:hypothetical protein